MFTDQGNPIRSDDWSCDGYFWVNKGGHGIPKANPKMWKRTYYISEGKGDGKGSKIFQRRMYMLKQGSVTYRFVQYIGDETCFVPRVHGNGINGHNYRRTFPSVLRHVKESSSSDSNPSSVFKKNQTGNQVKGSLQGRANLRSPSQVKFQLRTARNEKRLSHDELYSTLELMYHIEGFVHELAIGPDLRCVLGIEDLLQELNLLLQVESDEKLYMSYDTTFQVGDFYVSALVFRHILFQNNKTVPVAFFIHDKKSTRIHEFFWRTIKSLIPNLSKGSPVIVIDREAAIKNSLEEVFPNVRVIFCWNHIRRDVRFWLNQHRGSSDISIYMEDILQLLRCENEGEFFTLLEQVSGKWSEPFVDYFNSNVKDDIVNYAGWWVLSGLQLGNNYTGITNNIVEGVNSLIKSLNNWKEVSLDTAVLSFYYLQSYYNNEIKRGLIGTGTYRLKAIHKSAQLDPDDVQFSNGACHPDNVLELVKGKIDARNVVSDHHEDVEVNDENVEIRNPDTQQVPVNKPTSQRSLALAALNDNKVTHVPSARTFIVEGSQGSKYAVQLHPKETCQCPSIGTCYHIIAAKLSIGIDDTGDKRKLHMAQLRRNSRKRQDKKAGRKRPRPCDIEDDNIIPAPDSKLTKLSESVVCSTPNSAITHPVNLNPTSINDISEIGTPKKPKSRSRLSLTKKRLSNIIEEKEDQTIAISNKESVTYDDQASTAESDVNTSTTPKTRRSRLSLPKRNKTKVSEILVDLSDDRPSLCKPVDTKRYWMDNGKSTISFQEKDDILKDKKLCGNTMCYVQDMLKKQFSRIGGMQDTGYAPVLECNKWDYALRMKPVKAPAAQIHHTGEDHWVVSIQEEDNGEIYILDSLLGIIKRKGHLPASLEMQLSSAYGENRKVLKITVPSIQQQTNGVDCGLFAIANLVEFCFNGFNGKEDLEFEIDFMRQHLVQCIENGLFTKFPKKKKTKTRKKVSNVVFDIFIDCEAEGCHISNVFDDMVACDAGCDRWFHNRCVSEDSNIHFSRDSFIWKCRKCSQK